MWRCPTACSIRCWENNFNFSSYVCPEIIVELSLSPLTLSNANLNFCLVSFSYYAMYPTPTLPILVSSFLLFFPSLFIRSSRPISPISIRLSLFVEGYFSSKNWKDINVNITHGLTQTYLHWWKHYSRVSFNPTTSSCRVWRLQVVHKLAPLPPVIPSIRRVVKKIWGYMG